MPLVSSPSPHPDGVLRRLFVAEPVLLCFRHEGEKDDLIIRRRARQALQAADSGRELLR